MNTKNRLMSFVVMLMFLSLNAQDLTTVKAMNSDISKNLDLEVVASVFGESKDLEDFEKRLNDPKTELSNLDLNQDGEVDYLRVIDTSKGKTHLVTIQAVIGKEQYQDVAVVDIEKDKGGETQVQVVGDVYMYGPNFIISPVYIHRPVIWFWFWGPYYKPWRSPYHWRYYPSYYRPWRPYSVSRYQTNVRVNININNTYNKTTLRNSNTTVQLQNKTRKNDYGSKNPSKSYDNRNKSTLNKQTSKSTLKKSKESKGKKVQKDWKSSTEKQVQKSTIKKGKVTVPNKKQKAKKQTRPKTTTTTKTKTKIKSKPVKKGRGRGI